MARPLIVLKFGGSVLRGEDDLIRAARETESWIDRGWNVVAVVSAFEGVTDELVAKAKSFGAAPLPEAQALLTATGELQSASLLTLALQRAGVRASVGAPWSIGLRATSGDVARAYQPVHVRDGASGEQPARSARQGDEEIGARQDDLCRPQHGLVSPCHGDPLDAFPLSLNAAAVRVTLEDHRAIVVPGFIGLDELKRLVLLGRGGSDLSAIFISEALGAAKCRLVKDVDGLYEWDPAKEGPPPRRFASVSWVHALTLDGGIVQHKAVRFARERRLRFEVGGYGSASPTIVGDVPVEFSESASLVSCAQ